MNGRLILLLMLPLGFHAARWTCAGNFSGCRCALYPT
jgi:hypothetical protein